jgi:hypothetical protein
VAIESARERMCLGLRACVSGERCLPLPAAAEAV